MLPVLQDPDVEKTGKPKADKKLFVVVSLNTYEPVPGMKSTVFPQSQESKGQGKFDLVKSFLKGSGLKVLNELSDLSAIWVEGTVAQVEKAFEVSISNYKLKDREFFANDDDPSVPVDIVDAVVAIAGLEDFVVYEPLLAVASSLPQDVTPTGVTPSAETVGPPFDPYEIRNAYGFTPTLLAIGTPSKLTGTGINVAIIDAYGNPTMASDWSAFCYGTQNWGAGPWSGGALPTTPAISTFYPTGSPVTYPAVWALETAMDVEWVHAIAPGAKINLVISYDNSFAKMLAAFQWTITNKKGAVISMSFGADEVVLPAAYLSGWNTASRNGAKGGVTMLASSGDAGYYGGHIIHPSSDPYTVAVGGTALLMTGAYPGGRLSESAWSGSGGGRSILFAKPAWQWGTNVPLDGRRDTPDVALVADPNTGVYVRCASYIAGFWFQVGGTSLSAPIWAAFIAIVDQAVGASGSTGGIGLATPWLYRVFRSGDYGMCFHDITTGGQTGGYSAGTAYDLVTGIGTLKASNLLLGGNIYLRVAQTIISIPAAKAIAVTTAGTMYIGTFQSSSIGVLYELAKGSTTPRAICKVGGITDVAVDKNGKVYFMTYTKLYKYDPATESVSTLVSGLGWGWGVYVDKNLNVYYTDEVGPTGQELWWIPVATGVKAKLRSGTPFGEAYAGVYVDSALNIYVADYSKDDIYRMNAAHTTWTTWKNLGLTGFLLDLYLDARKAAYLACWDNVLLVDDYPLYLTGASADENIWCDTKTGIYYVDWSTGSVKYMPPETPT